MLRAIFADALFCAALFAESLALLSIFQAMSGLELPEEFTPIMNSYHAKTAPFAAIGSAFFASKPPAWYADAVLIAAVLFFLFFIAQARNAMAPYDDPQASPVSEAQRPRSGNRFYSSCFCVCHRSRNDGAHAPALPHPAGRALASSQEGFLESPHGSRSRRATMRTSCSWQPSRPRFSPWPGRTIRGCREQNAQ